MLTIRRADGYELSTDRARIDVDLVHGWLSTDAYWALGRPHEVLTRAIAGSEPFGVYRPDGGAQVAFARAVTDGATFAWICDVYVNRAERGRGLGIWMVDEIRRDLCGRGVRRLALATNDAHGVYAKIGFGPLGHPDRWMEMDHR